MACRRETGLPVTSGISVHCALDDVGPASLDGLLRRFASYRAVHLPRTGQLRAAGFPLVPSFRRPRYTIRLDGDDPVGLARLPYAGQ
jgi:hypothetical protein